MKYLKIYEAFNINKLFKQFVLSHESFLVTFKPYVGEDSEEDNEFTHSYNLYDIEDTDLNLEDVKYIIVGNFFTDEDNDQEFYVIDKYNNIRKATDSEDEAFREYEDDGNYFLELDELATFNYEDYVKSMKIDDKVAMKNSRLFVEKLDTTKLENTFDLNKGKLMGYKNSDGDISVKREGDEDESFEFNFVLYRTMPNHKELREIGITHFIIETYSNSNEYESTFYAVYNNGLLIELANDDLDTYFRDYDEQKELRDDDASCVGTIWDYFGDVTSTTYDEYINKFQRKELEDMMKKALAEEDYKLASEIKKRLSDISEAIQLQPNFELVKKLFYQAYVNSKEADTILMLQSVHNFPSNKSYHTNLKQFKIDFNKWLDGVDIREAGSLIDSAAKKVSVPSWLKNKQYVIDYNKHDMLDLIKKS